MTDLITELYEIVEKRKAEGEAGSYTAYLFEAGLDKILKKIGEEAAETIIAAKNLEREKNGMEAAEGTREELLGEIGDLLYHLIVLCSALGLEPEELALLLRRRMKKTGNLKAFRNTDRDT